MFTFFDLARFVLNMFSYLKNVIERNLFEERILQKLLDTEKDFFEHAFSFGCIDSSMDLGVALKTVQVEHQLSE